MYLGGVPGSSVEVLLVGGAGAQSRAPAGERATSPSGGRGPQRGGGLPWLPGRGPVWRTRIPA